MENPLGGKSPRGAWIRVKPESNIFNCEYIFNILGVYLIETMTKKDMEDQNRCYEELLKHSIGTTAICCLSTTLSNFPRIYDACITLLAIFRYTQTNNANKIIICTHEYGDYLIYLRILSELLENAPEDKTKYFQKK